VVIAGRNGSGKSTLAEGLEFALTGINSRWENKSAVWSRAWRNPHAGDPARIRRGLAEQGSGATVLGVDWPAGPDGTVKDMKRWVQRDGSKQEHLMWLLKSYVQFSGEMNRPDVQLDIDVRVCDLACGVTAAMGLRRPRPPDLARPTKSFAGCC